MTTTKYSVSAASRIVGKGRATITRHMDSGKLSYELNDRGHRIVDASELLRVYGEDCDFEREQGAQQQSGSNRIEKDELSQLFDVKEMQRQLERQYQAQIDVLKEALAKSQEGHNRATLLLEQRSGQQDEWKRAFEAMEDKLANVTDENKRQILELRKALAAERRKSIWQRLFAS